MSLYYSLALEEVDKVLLYNKIPVMTLTSQFMRWTDGIFHLHSLFSFFIFKEFDIQAFKHFSFIFYT